MSKGNVPVAWLVTSKRGMVRVAWTEKPSEAQVQVCEFDGDTITPLYATPVMASPTDANTALISRVFAEFRKDACVSGDDRVSEAFIKAGLTLLGAVDGSRAEPLRRNLEGLRGQILASRGIVRNAQGWPTHTGARDSGGWLYHPAIPVCDEGTRVDKLLEAFGIETSFVSMESDAADFYDRWCEEGLSDCSSWVPTAPDGEGWLLLEIYDTEDGPCALFGRGWYEAEKARKLAERAERRNASRADISTGAKP